MAMKVRSVLAAIVLRDTRTHDVHDTGPGGGYEASRDDSTNIYTSHLHISKRLKIEIGVDCIGD